MSLLWSDTFSMATPGRDAYTVCSMKAGTFIWPPLTAIAGRHRRHSSGHRLIHSHGQGQGVTLPLPDPRSPSLLVVTLLEHQGVVVKYTTLRRFVRQAGL